MGPSLWGRLELKSSLRRTDKSPKTSDDRHSVVDRWVRELLGGNKTAMDSRHKAAEGIGKLKEPKDLERARAATRSLLKLLKSERGDDCKVAAATALCNLSGSGDNPELLSCRKKAVSRLVAVLETGGTEARLAASHALLSIAHLGDDFRLLIVQAGAVQQLFRILHGPVGEETLPALRSLRELSFCAKACAMVATSDAASALPPLLSSKDPLVAEAAAWTLCTLSCTPGQQERLLRTEDGSLKEILELIRAGGTPADAAAWVLHNVCSSRQNLDRVADAGAVPILAGALVGGCGDLGKEAAVRTLSNLSCHSERLAAQVAEAGALRPLLALLKRSGSSTRLGLGAAMALCQLAMWKGTARILEDDGGLRAGLVGELALLLRSAPFPASGKGETSEHMQRLMDMAPTAVRRLADASKMLRLDLLEAGIVHSLVAVTREPGSSEASVAESAGALLNFLGTGEDGGSSHALEAALLSGAPSALVGVLDCRPSQAARKAAVKALQQLMILSSEGLAAARAAGAVPALLRQLDRWDDENPDPAAELAAMAITIGDVASQAAGGADALVRMLLSKESSVACAASLALAAVAQHCDATRRRLWSSTRAPTRLASIVSMSRIPQSAAAQAAAASALAVLASDGNSARRAIAKASLLELVALAGSRRPPAVQFAAVALAELGRSQRLRRRMASCGAVDVLAGLCRSGSPEEMEEAALALQCMRLEVPGEHQVPCEAEDADGELAGEWEEEDDTYEHLPLSPGADVSLSSVRTDWPGTSTPEAPCVGASREAGRLPVVLARCYSSVVGLVNTRLRPLQGHVQFYERCS